ncbi:MAG: hypothetical protein WA786_03325 [Acidimicrobiales bacterium]
MSSFDAPRPRSAPVLITGTDLHGEPVSITMTETTLIVAIKQSCDGCRDFVRSALLELEGVPVIILSATGDVGAEWVDAVHPIVVAPVALEQLEVRWPPFYVLVNPRERRVISEGVVLGPSQVASEIAPYLTPS